MGCSVSVNVNVDSVQVAISKQIDRNITKDADALKHIRKILLLGAGEAGKSTLMKQIKILHMNGFSDSELKDKKPAIYSNVLQSMDAIVQAMKPLNIAFECTERQIDADQLLKLIGNLETAFFESNQTICLAVAESLKRLWADRGVQLSFQQSSKYQLNDSAKYFFDHLDRISKPDYVPTVEDLLRARVETTGIHEEDFEINGAQIRMVDVGGQRSQRRKWIHCFENVTAILFLMALSEYDQTLRENNTKVLSKVLLKDFRLKQTYRINRTGRLFFVFLWSLLEEALIFSENRMQEAQGLFEAVCNSRWFKQSHIFLFLNKKDIFEEKIKRTSITIAFPDYAGPSTYEEASTFIRQKFEALKLSTEMQLYSYFTCATDTAQVSVIMDMTLEAVLHSAMKNRGLT